MPRILHIVQSLDPSWGGIARVLPELAIRLSAAGATSLIAALAGGRYGAPPALDGLTVRTFSASQGRLGRSRPFRDAAAELVRGCDVVHLHGLWTHQNWCAGSAARGAGRPCVMTPHSMMMPWAWRRSHWKKQLAGRVFEFRNLRRAALLHALSAGEAEYMRLLRFNPRIEVIPNGIDLARIDARAESPGSDSPVAELESMHPELAGRRWLLFSSRIHPQKSVRAVVDGWLDVALGAGAAEAADMQLVLAGPDETGMVPELESLAAVRGGRARITFVGMLGRDAVAAAMRRATFLVQPSESEGLSMSILEALAAGLPVLISPDCNMPEVAADGAGIVVAPRREDVAAAVQRIAQMRPEHRSQMSAAARRMAERFDWKGLIPRYIEMYERVAARR